MQRAFGLPAEACGQDRRLVLGKLSRMAGAATLARSCRTSNPEFSEALLAAALAELTATPVLARQDLA
jgi:hypothetical protein